MYCAKVIHRRYSFHYKPERSNVTLVVDVILTSSTPGVFTVTNLLKGTVLKNGVAQTFNYSFTPTTAGDYSATITLQFDLCDFDTTILLKGSATDAALSARATLAMGVIAVGSFKEDSVEVKNTGSSPVTLTEISGLEAPFSIIRPNAGYMLGPQQSVFVVIRYDALTEGSFKDSLNVKSNNPCAIVLSTEVTAGENSNPTGSGRTQIALGSDTSSSGSLVRIPLRIQSSENLVLSNAKNYTATISFNKNLLKPAGNTPQGIINGNMRTITISGIRNNDTLGVLKELEFTALLGDEACTDITIDSFTWTDGNATATTSNGQFCLSELCQAGGATRLVSAGGTQFMLYQVKPNPVSNDNTDIEYSLIEKGHTELIIADMLGRTVKTIMNDNNHNPGRYSVTLDVQDIPNGFYMLVLKSPTQSTTISLQVAK